MRPRLTLVGSPVHVAEAQADRVAAVLLAMETGPIAGFDITPHLVDQASPFGPLLFAQVEIAVGGERHRLAAGDARTLAAALNADPIFRGSKVIAEALRAQATEAEALVSHALAATPQGAAR